MQNKILCFYISGLGIFQPVGHLDFYPNGGIRQKGCGNGVIDSIVMEEGNLIYGYFFKLLFLLT